VERDLGMWEIDGIICDLSVIFKMMLKGLLTDNASRIWSCAGEGRFLLRFRYLQLDGFVKTRIQRYRHTDT
jgi:hypothetical protein